MTLSKYAVIAVCLLLGSMARSASAAEENVFLLSYFRGNGEAGVYLAWSTDGLNFQPLNNDKPVCPPAPWPGQNLTRDPSILYHDGKFRMVWTSSWRGRVFGYRESADLVHWSEPVQVKPFPDSLPAEDQPENVWAPEIHWDPLRCDYLILWSSTTPREKKNANASNDNGAKGGNDHRIYACRTADGKTFTPAQLFFDQGFSVIDAFMARDDGWIMVVKHEQGLEKNLRLIFAKPDLTGGWSAVGAPVVGPKSSIRPHEKAEGPSLLKTGDRWLLYWDAFANGHYGVAESRDLKAWTDLTDKLHVPKGTRHGTVFQAPRSAVGHLRVGK